MISGYALLSETAQPRHETREILNCQVFLSFAHGITRCLNFLYRLDSASAHCGRFASPHPYKTQSLNKYIPSLCRLHWRTRSMPRT